MSLGWGLRGYIGGGPLGAMIPGALVALALCILLERDDTDVALIAAFGAVGVGFGGQETYGQTIGLAREADTMWWGLLGLGIKGAVWGLLGGAIIGLAFVRRLFSRRQLVAALVAMAVGTFAGWKLIDEPKLMYFSNRLDRPREELWAGLLVGGLALLAALRRPDGTRVPHYFATWGFVGGGLGFFLGGAIQVAGRAIWPNPLVDWWKVMEFIFGLLFGMALGWAGWKRQQELGKRDLKTQVERSAFAYVATLAVAAAALAEAVPLRFDYTIAGACLLAVASRPTMAAWHIAVTITATAFFVDILGVPAAKGVMWAAACVIVASAATAAFVERFPGVRPMFLFLLIASVADSVVKSIVQGNWGGHFYVELVFVTMLAIILLWVRPILWARPQPAIRV
jgi:hypothetical protein